MVVSVRRQAVGISAPVNFSAFPQSGRATMGCRDSLPMRAAVERAGVAERLAWAVRVGERTSGAIAAPEVGDTQVAAGAG
ncbi:hypothetical protein GCM10007933_30980 [Zoogloea oryzae]|uniref:Uncharacterized protein n=1 Tax=Zoogloea oryzae TaxID=310767 RepID=A0ABQ6FE90_9RHOO|nr:hypothetical protein GCM10007933_30980 [Zoogloea oryzae]